MYYSLLYLFNQTKNYYRLHHFSQETVQNNMEQESFFTYFLNLYLKQQAQGHLKMSDMLNNYV